jgi:hypothetical protein
MIHQIGTYSIAPFVNSQARNAFLLFNCAPDRVKPIVVKLANGPAECLFTDLDLQFAAADCA